MFVEKSFKKGHAYVDLLVRFGFVVALVHFKVAAINIPPGVVLITGLATGRAELALLHEYGKRRCICIVLSYSAIV
jgi:hypothetical protein